MCNVNELLKVRRENKSLQEALAQCNTEKGAMLNQQAEIDALRESLNEAEAEMAALNSLITPPSPPDVFEEIQGVLIREMFRETFTEDFGRIFVSDRKFKITAQSEIRRFIEWDNVNIFPYVSSWHDCDDFAIALNGDFAKYPGWSGYPVALIWADYGIGPHGFAADIAWESSEIRIPRIYYIEPQNDYEIAAESMEGAKLQLLVI